ncbi:triose-phosphate isomerase [Saccharobesus litoralis]|uniref:Triosephosphate isomerase n=1 Tax=Saccharobesus litoralis TaxID=2172099 RepID=A0A2S0VPM1_9ALTE|nr:triose-phosphate isomerase [Saccharobesus litoralis]AWB66154.1 triose-phosphate isomerase [Saccharobesus litoralis]
MKHKLVIANWKMNGDFSSNFSLLKSIVAFADKPQNTQIAVCPPFVYLSQVYDLLESSPIALGAQNVGFAEKGAYTGETSASMLQEFACQYVLVGHSERRTLFKESDEHIAEKIKLAVAHNQTPVLCIGETLEERASNETQTVILSQIKTIIDKVGSEVFKSVVIAYEPIWAIGTGQTATAEQAQQIHALIRAYLRSLEPILFDEMTILYGGSVNENNADELFAQNDIDGFLVGGASLKAASFEKICFAGQAVLETA